MRCTPLTKVLCAILPAVLLAAPFLFPSRCLCQERTDITVHASRIIDTLGSGGPYGPDTLGVTLRYFAEGRYDTVWSVDTIYDTSRVPVDVVLALDLSTSMAGADSAIDSTGRARIVWAKLAALHFLDSLKTGDRVAVMGWTASGMPSGLADTANPSVYFHKWCGFTAGFDSVKSFIRDSIFIDSTRRIVDTCEGQALVVRDNIPNGNFMYTPMHLSTVVTAKHLSNAGRPAATRAVIMLTDGVNNDRLAQSVPVALLDSLYRTQGQRFFAIGFIAGDTAELRTLTDAGGGACYNAANPRQLDSIYALLAKQLVEQRIDTTYRTTPIRITPDTIRQPIDVLLAVDLSSSMTEYDYTSRERITWAKIAALGFIDSLKSQDRVAIFGWTSIEWGKPAVITDTAYDSIFYRKWCPFTGDLDDARSFLRDSLHVDSMEGSLAYENGPLYDTLAGDSLLVWKDIPGGWFNYTPLHCTSVMTMSRLSTYGRPGATKVVVLLTDGINNDSVRHSFAIDFVDSLRRTEGLLMHTIGFVNGDSAELHELATAGGGNFYNAANSTELQSAYASLAHQLVTEKVAARKLTIQEVLNSPPLYVIAGTQGAGANSTVPLEKTEALTDSRGNQVLRWYFKTVPVWGAAEAYCRVVAMQGSNTVIGEDSTGAGGGYWSKMVYTDNDYQVITINLPETGTPPEVSVRQKGEIVSGPDVAFRPNRLVLVSLAGQRSVAMALYSLSGRVVYRDAARFSCAGATARFTVPETLPPGVYAACFVFEDRRMLRYIMNILR